MLVLLRVTRFGALDGYKGRRKLLRGNNAMRGLRFVELEGSGAKTLVAIIEDETLVDPLADGVRKFRRTVSKPELTCGDDETLAGAGFSVVRTQQLAEDGRGFVEVK